MNQTSKLLNKQFFPQFNIANICIPTQLMNQTFIKMGCKSKKPIEEWSNQQYHYSADDSRLLEHIRKGNNYAVFLKNDLIVVDIDNKELFELMKLLPSTFTIKTRKGYHLYFYCSEITEILFLKKNGINFGEIRANHLVVAPYSVVKDDDSGIESLYVITSDMPIASIELSELARVFSKYLPSLIDLKTNNYNTKNYKTTNYNRMGQPAVKTMGQTTGQTEIEEEYDLFEDDETEKNNFKEYYPRKGFSFLRIDSFKGKRILRSIGKDIVKYCAWKGKLYSTTNEAVINKGMEDIDILIPNNLRRLLKARRNQINPNRPCHLIVYRPTHKLYQVHICQDESELLEWEKKTEIESIEAIYEFRDLYHLSMRCASRHENKTFIQKLIEDIRNNSVSRLDLNDNKLIAICYYGIKDFQMTNEEIHRIYKWYFESKYNEKETNAQIQWAKKPKN